MRPLAKLAKTEAKLLAREPMAVLFTLAFPLIVLFVFGAIFGNQPSPQTGGFGSVDVFVPGYLGMIIRHGRPGGVADHARRLPRAGDSPPPAGNSPARAPS